MCCVKIQMKSSSLGERDYDMNKISLVDTAYMMLRERMVCGELMPETLLSENELAEEYQMSRTPIRHAIARLESEGYVTALKNRGVLVKDVGGKEFLDLIEQIQSMLFILLK